MTVTTSPHTATRRVDVTEDGDVAFVSWPYDDALLAAFKATFPDRFRRWDGMQRRWELDLNRSTTPTLMLFARKHGFVGSTAGVALLRKAEAEADAAAAAEREIIEASTRAAADFEVAGLGGTLRPFQRAGVAYAVRQRRTFIADEMGLGKTIQALATLQSLTDFPAVIVCPASLKRNWQREARIWLPKRRAFILDGNAPGVDEDHFAPALFAVDSGADLYIVNYDVLASWIPTLRARGIKAVVFDESHYLKTPGAQRTKAAVLLTGGIGTVLCLTGTPVLNRPTELASQLQVMGRLKEMGGRAEIEHMAERGELHDLNNRLRSCCFIRRTKAQVLTELPPKQREVVPLDLDNWTAYRQAERDLIAYLRTIDWERADRLAGSFALALVQIEVLKQLAAKGKMRQAIEWVDDFLQSGSPLVLFGWHKEIVRALGERFKAPIIMGETPLADRDAAVQRFQAGKERLIVLNMQAGGLGLTLTAASSVAMLEQGWTPAAHDQAEDRVHRIGQTDSVNAYYLLAPGTIDERIQRLIEAKRVIVDATTEGAAGASTSIVGDLIRELVGKRE